MTLTLTLSLTIFRLDLIDSMSSLLFNKPGPWIWACHYIMFDAMACNVLWTTCVSIRVCIVYSVMWGLKPVASDLALSSLPLCDLITTPKLSVTVVPPLHSPHHTHLTSLQDNTTTTAAQHRKRTTTTITTSTTHQYDDNHCKHNYFDRLEEKCF